MPVAQEEKLSLEAFHARYDGEKPYFEFWDGEAVQKSIPTRLHALIQTILVRLLYAIGFDAGQEITLKLVPDWQPIPDVIAAEGRIGNPYPLEPVDVVVGILSADDSFSRVIRKCARYERCGIKNIVVVDPAARVVWSWLAGSLGETDVIARRQKGLIPVEELWAEVDRELNRPSH